MAILTFSPAQRSVTLRVPPPLTATSSSWKKVAERGIYLRVPTLPGFMRTSVSKAKIAKRIMDCASARFKSRRIVSGYLFHQYARRRLHVSPERWLPRPTLRDRESSADFVLGNSRFCLEFDFKKEDRLRQGWHRRPRQEVTR